MTIEVEAVYEGDGVLKLGQPVALEAKQKVRVLIETQQEVSSGPADDPTGWRTIDRLMGIGKAVAPDVAERHDDYLYYNPRG